MKKFLVIILVLFSLCSRAQYYNDGQDRGNLKWERISTLHFEVIFPKGFEEQGARVANLMEKSYQFTTKSLQHSPKKISIVLHTETVKSNAFLGWAPSRIEMYTTPHQDIYSQDWLEQLAIHEYRHMVQISKLDSEMPKLLRFLFGEQAAALLTAIYLPFWYIEGDAVVAETALSESGRGRLPDFHRELKAQVLEKGIYSYDKAYLGSYKDYVANHYHLGYFMVGGAREMFNKTIWESVEHTVARKPLLLNSFDKGLKKSIGFKKVQLYDTVFNSLKARWLQEDEQKQITSFHILSKKNKFHTNYNFGFYLNDSIIIAEKTGMTEIGQFVAISKSENEKAVFTPGYHFTKSVSGHDSLLVWCERLTHPRYYHSDYSLLRIFNIYTQKLKEYRFESKLFAPALSPDSKYLVAVEGDDKYQFYLNIIDISNGEIIKKINLEKKDYYITPSWSQDGKSVYTIVLRNNQKGIVKIDINTEEESICLPFASQEISNPIEYKSEVYFVGAYSGVDNLYKVNSKGELFEVISTRFGLADPSISQGNLLFSNYTSDGYELAGIRIDSVQCTKVKIRDIQYNYPIAEAASKQELGVIDFSNTDAIDYKSEKYSKAANLFRLHSWAPLAVDPVAQTVQPGFSVMSQNMLSTAEFVAGYRYDLQNTQGEWFANFKYYGWYPIFEFDTYSGKRESFYYQLNQYVNSQDEIVRVDTVKNDFSYAESSFAINSYVPINLSKGKFYRKIQPRLKYRYTNYNADYRAPNSFPNGAVQILEGGIYMYQILKSSEQDLLPNFGIVFDLSVGKSLAGVVDYGSIYAVSNVLYLPGIKANHGVSVYNGFQFKDRTSSAFSDRIRFPRGHTHIANDKMYSLGTDYQLPLLYPDFGLLNLAYIKRINLKLFYDYAIYRGYSYIGNTQTTYSGSLRSTGLELTSDLNLLRFIAPIELGFRTSYLFDGNFKADFLFNIQFTF